MNDGVVDKMSYEFFLYLLSALILTVLGFVVIFILRVLGTVPRQAATLLFKARRTWKRISAFLS